MLELSIQNQLENNGDIHGAVKSLRNVCSRKRNNHEFIPGNGMGIATAVLNDCND